MDVNTIKLLPIVQSITRQQPNFELFTKDSFLEDLFKSPLIQRLQGIDQSGPDHYFASIPRYSRLEHSIGVAALVSFAGGSIQEQAAALSHDASHTVFSHTADYLYKMISSHKSYQDNVHMKILKEYGVDKLADKHGVDFNSLDPECHEYKRLEAPLPHLCADRIEYNLTTGLKLKKITVEELDRIIGSLRYSDLQGWYFTQKHSAVTLARLSEEFTKNLWGTPENHLRNHLLAETLQQGLDKKLFSHLDLHCLRDSDILKMFREEYPDFSQKISILSNPFLAFEMGTANEHTFSAKNKCRMVDPIVQDYRGEFKRLTEIDENMKKQFEELKIQSEIPLFFKKKVE